MPIRLRFLLVANVFLVGLGIVGFVAITNLDRAAETFSEATRRGISQVQLSDQLRANIPDLRTLELEYVMSDPVSGVALRAEMTDRRKSLRKVMTHYHQEGKGASLSTCGSCHHASENSRAIVAGSGSLSSKVAATVLQGGVSADVARDTTDPSLNGCLSCHRAFRRFLQSHNQIETLASQGRREEALASFRKSEAPYTALLEEAESFRQSQYALVRQESTEGHAASLMARNTLIATFAVAAVITFLVGHHFSLYIHRRLAALGDGTRRVIRGELNQPIRMQGRDEFAALATAFDTMTHSLQTSHTENVQLHEAAIRMREERIALLSDGLRRATEAQENERKRVARELHDEVGQALTGLQFGLGRLAKMTRSARIRETTESLKELTVETLRGVRNLALDLRPSLLDDIGLAATLHHYVEAYSARTGIPVQLNISGLSERLRPELEITVFRIVQEALTNTARYASASQAWVGLALEDDVLTLLVRDNGAGFDVEATRADYRRSLGLSGMEERCRFSDGTLTVESAAGQGATVACTWRDLSHHSQVPAGDMPAADLAPAKLSQAREEDPP